MYYNAFGHLKTNSVTVKPVPQPVSKVTAAQYEQFIKVRAAALAGKA